MDSKAAEKKFLELLKSLYPLTQHSDLYVYPAGYDPESETIYIELIPRVPVHWSKVAYQYGRDKSMTYDREWEPYGIDGQPRVSSDGLVWVRYVTDFEGSRAKVHIWAQQPSHGEAEEQLVEFYRLFREHEGIEPIQVFQRMWKASGREGGD